MNTETNAHNSDSAMRIYRASAFWKATLGICAACSIGFSLALLAQDLKAHPSWQSFALELVLGLLFITLGVYCSLCAFRGWVGLLPDQLLIRGAFRTKSIRRDEIRGWRIVQTTLYLYLKSPKARALKVALMFTPDVKFFEWLGRAEPLDITELQASLREIHDDESLGHDARIRHETARRWHSYSRVLNGVATIVALWGVFRPRPYVPLIATLAALPWVAAGVAWKSRGFVRLDEIRNDAHPNLAFVLLLPALILGLRATLDYELLWSFALVVWSMLITAILMLALTMVDATMAARRSSVFALVFFALLYGYGFTVEANGFHSVRAATYKARIERMQITDSKRLRYEVTLGAWSRDKAGGEIDVSKAEYESMHPGDVVSVVLHTGWLGVEWYYLER